MTGLLRRIGLAVAELVSPRGVRVVDPPAGPRPEPPTAPPPARRDPLWVRWTYQRRRTVWHRLRVDGSTTVCGYQAKPGSQVDRVPDDGPRCQRCDPA